MGLFWIGQCRLQVWCCEICWISGTVLSECSAVSVLGSEPAEQSGILGLLSHRWCSRCPSSADRLLGGSTTNNKTQTRSLICLRSPCCVYINVNLNCGGMDIASQIGRYTSSSKKCFFIHWHTFLCPLYDWSCLLVRKRMMTEFCPARRSRGHPAGRHWPSLGWPQHLEPGWPGKLEKPNQIKCNKKDTRAKTKKPNQM